ncbi:hypothetical protein DM02DRAFT_702563 [Periconia macrospinosa]|uniref:F-box domain-containing protein n=1 Tax=Periconia macrospinosa TaxID=97972 RepID=A0A2V1D1I1_9PLEO|nr:hypothetical protein DM02DRAFT_702563 [Periconia macrospinosa]
MNAAVDNIVPRSPANLLNLPKNIRNMIYEYIVDEETQIYALWELDLFYLKVRSGPTPYTRVCTIMRRESRPIWLRKLVVKLYDTTDPHFVETFFPSIKPATPLPGTLVGPKEIQIWLGGDVLKQTISNNILPLVQLFICAPETKIKIVAYSEKKNQLKDGFDILERVARAFREDLEKGQISEVRFWLDQDFHEIVGVGFVGKKYWHWWD